jgi:hypothetical protein
MSRIGRAGDLRDGLGRRAATPVREDGSAVQDSGPGHGHHRGHSLYRGLAVGGWSGRDLVSLYVMLGIGVAIMLYVRFWGGSDYFSLPRETYQPEADQPRPQSAVTRRRPDLPGSRSGISAVIVIWAKRWSDFVDRSLARGPCHHRPHRNRPVMVQVQINRSGK